jgi:hypothetical protein
MVSATPPIGSSSSSQSANSVGNTNAIKVASPDIVLIDQDQLPVELLSKMIFEEIGGQQLLAVSRHDIVNGQQVVYRPISNIQQIAIAYNPGNIIPIQDPNKDIFGKFFIDLAKRIPSFREVITGGIVSFDQNNDNIEILVQNMAAGEEVEVQILSSAEVFDDTIYQEEQL